MTRIAILFLALLLCGCAGSKTETKEYQMRGVVMSVDASGHTATIKHEAIKGFMGAMTMGYPVKDRRRAVQTLPRRADHSNRLREGR